MDNASVDAVQLPSQHSLQQHMQEAGPKPSSLAATPEASAPAGDAGDDNASSAPPTTTMPLTPAPAERPDSYKSPLSLLTAPSAGKVSIAGRRLATGEVVAPEVIHLQDYAPKASRGAASNEGTSSHSEPPPVSTSPKAPPTPAAATAAATASDPHTIQETTRTSEQVYITHATVAAAAAAAGGLVGGAQHLAVRTAANIAEAAVDPAAVVDYDSLSPTAATTAAAAATGASSLPSTPATASARVSEGGDTPQQQQEAGRDSSLSTEQGAADSEGGHVAVLPEDREEVAVTLQRLRGEGQLQGPTGRSSTTSSNDAAAATATAPSDDCFVGAAAAPDTTTSSHHPSAQGVSAGTAAPAKAGYPDRSVGTPAEQQQDASTQPAPADAGNSSSSNPLAMHDAAARAAAVAGALHHIGQPVNAAAVLADTATQPAQAVEDAAAAAVSATSYDSSSPATSTAARAGSLQQQHTLRDFLLDEPDVMAAAAIDSAADGSGSSSAAHAAGQEQHVVDLSAGRAAAGSEDDLQVQLDVGRSTRLLSADGSVAAAAATVPQEAVDVIKAESPRSPRHPSLRQLTTAGLHAADTATTSSSARRQQQDKAGSELPYGLTVADIVAATVASEERRFRVVSPRSTSSGGDTFFSATSSSAPSSPPNGGAGGGGGPTVERSSSPLSSSATRAIFDSVQLAVQQQQGDVAGDGAGDPFGLVRGMSAGRDATVATAGGAADSSSGSTEGPAAEVTQENAEVMQEMLLQGVAASAAEQAATEVGGQRGTSATAAPAGAEAVSISSTVSQMGGSLGDSLRLADLSISSVTSTGDRLAAAVAAGAADGVAAAAAGTDVAATAAPAFPSVLFTPGPMPIDVPASPRSASGQAGATPAADTATDPTAVELASSGLSALSADRALQQVVEASTSAAIESARMSPTAAAAAAAAGAATELHADAPDATAAANDAAQLVVDAAAAAPGLLDSEEVASAAAAAGTAAAAAAALPGMDVATAAVACAVAASAPMSAASDVAAAAAQAVADMQAMAALGVSGDPVRSSAAPLVAPMMTDTPQVSSSISGSSSDNPPAPSAGGDLSALLPILAPSGHIADAVPLPLEPVSAAMPAGGLSLQGPALGDSSSSIGADAAGSAVSGGSGSAAAPPPPLPTVPETSELVSSTATTPSSSSNAADPFAPGSGIGLDERVSAPGGQAQLLRPQEVLNREGLSTMYDPLIVQLALASSAPLEGLGMEASALLAGDGGGAAIANRAGFNSAGSLGKSGSFGRGGSGGSGMLMIHPHPLLGQSGGSFSAASEGGGGGSSGVLGHIAAAEEALSQLDAGPLQRQRTDSISLGAGRSAALGELDDAVLAALGGVSGSGNSTTAAGNGGGAAEAPAGPDAAAAAAGGASGAGGGV